MRDPEMAMTLRRLALEAGAAILAVRAGADLGLATKADASPVTEADLAADRIICAGLGKAYPEIPVVTEERAESHALGQAETHFLVDPLDGTKEFVREQGEFTVNIALVEGGRPVAGVVYAPAAGRLFRTAVGGGALEETGDLDPAAVGSERPIRVAEADDRALRVVASKSHRDAETDAFIARHAVAEFKSAGSSLKFCLLAAGEADLYPRLAPTMEWDTAAGQAVLEAAGGRVLRMPDLSPMVYGRTERRNPPFVAIGAGVTPRMA
jgi:3'(2'), 5'-bisphosphate nucleotidase